MCIPTVPVLKAGQPSILFILCLIVCLCFSGVVCWVWIPFSSFSTTILAMWCAIHLYFHVHTWLSRDLHVTDIQHTCTCIHCTVYLCSDDVACSFNPLDLAIGSYYDQTVVILRYSVRTQPYMYIIRWFAVSQISMVVIRTLNSCSQLRCLGI